MVAAGETITGIQPARASDYTLIYYLQYLLPYFYLLESAHHLTYNVLPKVPQVYVPGLWGAVCKKTTEYKPPYFCCNLTYIL